MAAFPSKSFDVSGYEAFRPTYPFTLFDTIYAYHSQSGGQFGTCVDLGCGTGKSMRDLAMRFDKVVGVDPSEAMIEVARKEGGKTKGGEEIGWEIAPSDELAFLKDASVDIVTGATCCQYFKYPETWHELSRILKPQGTVAFFNYTRQRLGSPLSALNPLADHWSEHVIHARDVNSTFGIAQDVIVNLSPPEDLFDKATLERHLYVGEHWPPEHFNAREEIIMRLKLTWDQLGGFYRSGRATHRYFERHLEDRQNPEGDVITRMMKELKAEAEKMGYKGNVVNVEYPMVLLMVRKTN
ncbi:S-adenosyl-L-methionine-dependent methyltransferase [Calocera viscosa TUFC12733]|uniref:S-adenosyl-L-methionine-dependent methyltransferase n=1 Tax=Calocera viscosa (strain TUFC12733) TaxID=1330018 RepID=A0A167MV23_CALVF|nr:S-adenosyl-L-methionine-dependent methyltransferase [Calocera viscosa TUFC12733]